MKKILKILFFSFSFLFLTWTSQNKTDAILIDKIAESYVKLVLKLGVYDPNYVDSYFGPDEWRSEITGANKSKKLPYEKLKKEVTTLLSNLETINCEKYDKIWKLRYVFLKKQLLSVNTKIDLLSGKKITFDEESKALFDAVAPTYDESYFENVVKNIDKNLPGKGNVSDKINNLKNKCMIPENKSGEVFKAAVAESRKRTQKNIKLPNDENFKIELVSDKPWLAYNWYKGDSKSLIQINTSIPISINYASVIACHEGYPGHHVHFTLLQKLLYQEKGWIEFSILPLFSPLALIAEGIATYAINMVFPADERILFEREVLFPIAGFDFDLVSESYHVLYITENLHYGSYSTIEAARRYLDGKMNKTETINWLINYSLLTSEEAEQHIQFFEQYRSYIINYKLGYELIKSYMDKNIGIEIDHQKRWELFGELLTTPRTPSGLID